MLTYMHNPWGLPPLPLFERLAVRWRIERKQEPLGGCFIYSMGWPWKATVSEIWGRLTQSSTHIECIYENRLGIKEKNKDWLNNWCCNHINHIVWRNLTYLRPHYFSLLGVPCADGTNQHSAMTAVCDTATHSKWQSVTSQETWWEWQISNEPLQPKPLSILLHLFNWNRIDYFSLWKPIACSIKTVMKDIARALVWS